MYKRYKKYKASGVEWIGEIPAGWEVRMLKYLGLCQNGISAGAEYFGSGYPFISYGDVYKNISLPNVVSGLANSSEKDRNNYSVKKGDVFFTRTSETIEEIAFASTCLKTLENAIFSGFIIRFRPFSSKLFDGYSKYYFRNPLNRRFFVKEMNLVTRTSLSQGLLKRLPILIPIKKEQEAIANFLDQKTALIDRIISNRRKQIELLKEERKAVINKAVTKGINKKAKLKPSGIEWLGDIPEHWKIAKLKRVVKFIYGNTLQSENRTEGDIPVYGSNGIVGYHNVAITKNPCIIVGRKGSHGKINYSEKSCFPIDTTYFIDETATENNLRWLFYVFQTLNLDETSQDTGVPGLSREVAYAKLLQIHSISEQKAIAKFLDNKTAKIDTIITKYEKQISLLKEYRTSLISKAVTGQIMV